MIYWFVGWFISVSPNKLYVRKTLSELFSALFPMPVSILLMNEWIGQCTKMRMYSHILFQG